MKNKKIVILSFLFILLMPNLLLAQMPLDKSSISGIRKLALSSGNLYFNINGEFPSFQKILNPNTGGMMDFPKSFVRTEAYLNASVLYGINNKFNVFLNVPFSWLNHYTPDLIQENKGFGDIDFGALYQLFGEDLSSNTSTIKLAVKAPTGESNNLSNDELPLGSGAWEFSAALQGMFHFTSWNLLYSANYSLSTQNGNDINPGDHVWGILSFEKNLNTKFGDFTLESGFELSNFFEGTKDGNAVANSSEFSAAWFPAIAYNFSQNLRLSYRMPFTFYKRDSWFTDYSAVLQIEYYLDFNNYGG